MKPVLLYLLQVIICSGLLYAYYHLLLRNKKFHLYNRYYLLTAVVISILVPFLNIPVYFNQHQAAVWLQALSQGDYTFAVPAKKTAATFFTSSNLLTLMYVLASGIVLCRFVISIYRIRKLIGKHRVEKLNGINFVNTEEKGTPFSFFHWLFWNNKIHLDSPSGQQIFRHELFHIRQKHSWDIIFTELVSVVFWINPFFHLFKKELTTIHEFLADQFAVQENEKWNYAELLLMHLLGSLHLRFTHPFFHNQIKRRIAMITSSKKPKYQYLRKMLVLPLLVLIAGLFAFTYRQRQEVNNEERNSEVSKLPSIANNPGELIELPLADTAPQPTPPKLIKKKDVGVTVEDVIVVKGKPYGNDKMPLFIIDNVLISNADELKLLKPDHIESINILKDKSAIALYGPRASGGVVIITTKIVKGLKLEEVKADVVVEDRSLELQVDEGKPVPVNSGQSDLNEVVVTGHPSEEIVIRDVAVIGKKLETVNETDVSKLSPLYPNPASHTVILPFSTQTAGAGEIRIQDASGKVFRSEKVNLVKGLNNLNVNVASLPPGTYIISVTDANKGLARTYKMIKDGAGRAN